jgi:hypothetical protein
MSGRRKPALPLIGQVADMLLGEGFTRVHRSISGSVYLKLEPEDMLLRLSHHSLPRKYRTRDRRNLALSVRLTPTPPSQVKNLAMGIAFRYLAACERRA